MLVLVSHAVVDGALRIAHETSYGTFLRSGISETSFVRNLKRFRIRCEIRNLFKFDTKLVPYKVYAEEFENKDAQRGFVSQ